MRTSAATSLARAEQALNVLHTASWCYDSLTGMLTLLNVRDRLNYIHYHRAVVPARSPAETPPALQPAMEGL